MTPMEEIAELHARLQLTISGLLVLLALWGLLCVVRGAVGRWYGAALRAAALLIVAQGLLGAMLLARAGWPPAMALHAIYGIVAMIGLPTALAYCRGRSGRREALALAAACLFLLGVVIRAYATAG